MKQKIKWGKTKPEETAEEEKRSPVSFSIRSISCKPFYFPQQGHHILHLLNSCPIRFEIVINNSALSFLLGRHFTATYMSLLDGFPASKFSLAYFNPDKGESKKAAPKLLILQKKPGGGC